MRPQPNHISAADYYLGVLKNLSPESKLDLIAHLSQSLKKDYAEQGSGLKTLFGAYKGGESAEEIIEGIRSARVANRMIEPL